MAWDYHPDMELEATYPWDQDDDEAMWDICYRAAEDNS